MKRAVLLVAALFVPLLAEAQHGGGCACGTPSTPMQMEVEASGDENLAIQTEMAKWNRYVDVFRPVAGDSVMGPNGTNEIGFLWGGETEWIYGEGYYLSEYVLGVAILYPRAGFGWPPFNACPVPAGTNCGTFSETDIVLNKSFYGRWQAKGYPAFQSNAASVNATALHELGHTIGLHHNWRNISTMNYYEDFAGWYLSAADAAAARQHLPWRAQATTDVATYPFVFDAAAVNNYSATQTITTNSSTVVRGSHMPITNFTVENVGTTHLSNVVLRFYLTADRNVTASDYEIGSLTFASMSSLGYFDGLGRWFFRIPESTPVGQYYVGAIVSYDGTQQDTVTYNNAWTSEERVTVTATPDPLVTITGPTDAATYTSSLESIGISGTLTATGATWNIYTEWVNTTSGLSGFAPKSADGTSWSATVPLVLGPNEIIVRSRNGNGATNSDAITITLDNTRPTVTITTPATRPLFTIADSYPVAGTATDEQTSVAGVTWSSNRVGSGTASGTAQWSTNVPLLAGANVITITATDGEGKVGRDVVTIHRDMNAPVASIALPDTEPAYSTSYPTIVLNGSAGDDSRVASVSWTNDRGGSGTAAGTDAWNVQSLPLQVGANVITVTVRDVVGRTATDTATIMRRSDTVPPVVAITTPSTGVMPASYSTIVIYGTASDNDTLDRIRLTDTNGRNASFYASRSWGVQLSVPYGTSILTFRAVDAAQNESAPVTVTVVRKTKGDFGGEGKSELLWRKPSTGETTLWTMDKLAVAATNPLPSMPLPWVVNGVDDFNGDGKSDILWRNGSTGALVLWRMDGPTVVASEAITASGTAVTLPATRVVEAVGDFNADTRADILVRDTTTNQARIWLMISSSVFADQYVAAPPMQWSVQGVGDFSGDGKVDILWRNSNTNEAWAWLMNGSAIASTGYVASPPPIWSVKGVADFTGDGRADIVWRNSNTHQVVIWPMYTFTIWEYPIHVAVPAGVWDIRAVGNFNGDGHADMMWRNTSTGENVIWLMSYGYIAESGWITAVPDQEWTVVGPR